MCGGCGRSRRGTASGWRATTGPGGGWVGSRRPGPSCGRARGEGEAMPGREAHADRPPRRRGPGMRDRGELAIIYLGLSAFAFLAVLPFLHTIARSFSAEAPIA